MVANFHPLMGSSWYYWLVTLVGVSMSHALLAAIKANGPLGSFPTGYNEREPTRYEYELTTRDRLCFRCPLERCISTAVACPRIKTHEHRKTSR